MLNVKLKIHYSSKILKEVHLHKTRVWRVRQSINASHQSNSTEIEFLREESCIATMWCTHWIYSCTTKYTIRRIYGILMNQAESSRLFIRLCESCHQPCQAFGTQEGVDDFVRNNTRFHWANRTRSKQKTGTKTTAWVKTYLLWCLVQRCWQFQTGLAEDARNSHSLFRRVLSRWCPQSSRGNGDLFAE